MLKITHPEKVLHLFANPLKFIYLYRRINKIKPKKSYLLCLRLYQSS